MPPMVRRHCSLPRGAAIDTRHGAATAGLGNGSAKSGARNHDRALHHTRNAPATSTPTPLCKRC